VDLAALKIFLTVAQERSFSRAAAKVHRTQPAVSQAVRRLETELGEQLFDRSSKTGTLTEAGRMLQNYGHRLVRLAEETESAVRDLRDLRRGRVLTRRRFTRCSRSSPAFANAIRRSRPTCGACRRGRLPSKSSRGASTSAR
jgi:DNA-binding transcriptional LysR family regulator